MAGILDQKTGLLTQAPTGTTINESGVVNRPITTESLQPTPAIKLPDIPQQNSTEADTILGGAGATAQNLQTITQQLTPEPTALDKQLQDLLGANVVDTQQMAQKGADQLSAEQAQGIPQLKTQFGELNTQLAVKLAESKALDTSYQQANEQAKQGVFNPQILAGKQAQNYRMYLAQKNAKASEIGLLQAQAQGLQGQIGLAQETANRAVDLKYSVLENNLAVRKAQLEAIQPLLNKQEKVQALAQQTLLEQEKQKVADQKQIQKDIQGLVLEAASKGASSAILSAISGAKTLTEASQVFSSLVRQQVVPVSGVGGQPSSKEIKEAAQAAEVASLAQAQINLADNILDSSGFTGAVGPNRFARFRPVASLTGATSDFIASVEQLTNQQTLKTLTDLKKAGGTLGALSEKELTLLQDSATKINNWALRDKNGKVYAYKASEKDFKAEINRIKTLAEKAVENAAPPVLNDSDPLNLGITPTEDPLKLF